MALHDEKSIWRQIRTTANRASPSVRSALHAHTGGYCSNDDPVMPRSKLPDPERTHFMRPQSSENATRFQELTCSSSRFGVVTAYRAR